MERAECLTQCPVACDYCMAQHISIRADKWDSGERIGMNKSCVFINRLANDVPLKDMPFQWTRFRYEIIGFQGITDCMWSVYKDDLLWLISQIETLNIRKLVLCTKMVVPYNIIDTINQSAVKDRILFIVSTTGLDKFERIKTADRIKGIERLLANNIDVFPMIHPYIHGVSNIDFLNDLSSIGIRTIGWKGFRYNPERMTVMTDKIGKELLKPYDRNTEEEVLIGEEHLREEAEKQSLVYTDMKAYIAGSTTKTQTEEQAKEDIEALAKQVVFSTSSSKESVIRHRIAVRTGAFTYTGIRNTKQYANDAFNNSIQRSV